MDCGGKRSATPLFAREETFSNSIVARPHDAAVLRLLFPLRFGSLGGGQLKTRRLL